MGSSRGDALRVYGVLQVYQLMEGLVDAKVEVRGCLRGFVCIGRITGNSVEEV